MCHIRRHTLTIGDEADLLGLEQDPDLGVFEPTFEGALLGVKHVGFILVHTGMAECTYTIVDVLVVGVEVCCHAIDEGQHAGQRLHGQVGLGVVQHGAEVVECVTRVESVHLLQVSVVLPVLSVVVVHVFRVFRKIMIAAVPLRY